MRLVLKTGALAPALCMAVVAALSCASPPPPSNAGALAPRYERVDHFWWLVRDIDATARVFRDALGFTLGDDVGYPFARLRHIWFADGTFLELVSPLDSHPSLGPAVDAFLRVHEGAWKMGVYAGDLSAVAVHLAAHGLSVAEPSGGTWQSLGARSDLPGEMWRGLELRSTPGHLLYFWHFTDGWERMRRQMPDLDPLRPARTEHPNTVRGLHAPWLATWDLERSASELAFLSTRTSPSFEVPHVQAIGRWLDLAAGRLLLLQPATRASPVMEFLFLRGEGVIGVSLEVSSLDRARAVIEAGTGEALEPYMGLDGPSIILPARSTHGVIVELVDRSTSN